MSETRTQTGEGVLVDEVRESPVDKYLLRHRRRLLLALLVIVLVLVLWWLLARRGKPAWKGGWEEDHGYAVLLAPQVEEGAVV